MCGAAPGKPCRVVHGTGSGEPGDRPGDDRPDMHFYRGGCFTRPSILITEEPPFDPTPEQMAEARAASDRRIAAATPP